MWTSGCGCALGLAGLCLASAGLWLGRWSEARALRTSNPLESEARVSLGLLAGEKRLNPGYGWRHYPVSAWQGSHPARGWAVVATGALCAGGAVCAGAAAFCLALRLVRPRTSRAPAILASLLSAMCLGVAAAAWGAEHSLRLAHNVMSAEELANMWSSEGGAWLGLSYWLCVGACVCACACVVLTLVSPRAPPAAPPPRAPHEKHAAIMLY